MSLERRKRVDISDGSSLDVGVWSQFITDSAGANMAGVPSLFGIYIHIAADCVR